VATLELAARLREHPDVELVGVAGRHRSAPATGFEPPIPVRSLPIARPWLYEAWNRLSRPRVERVTGPIDVCHSTIAIPAATTAPHVVTVHDVAFVHAPERFTRHGVRVMNAGLERCRAADLVLCPSETTCSGLVELGFDADRIRVIPWGVDATRATGSEIERVRGVYDLPDRFVLFVGTIEPRKNLTRLAEAVARLDEPIDLVVVGAQGWGTPDPRVRTLGFVPVDDLRALYGAATVFAYPSLEEGFGLPVAEAMAQGAAVVTSVGTATEEVAGGAGVLVDPLDVESIAAGLAEALQDPAAFVDGAISRAAALSWDSTVEATVAAYRDVVR